MDDFSLALREDRDGTPDDTDYLAEAIPILD
jgi:hypothetical protein